MLTTLLAAAVLATKFGVHFSGDGPLHDHPEFVTDAGASWVRLNLNLNPNDQDYTVFLAAGTNVVLTMNNRDPSNVDTTYGSLSEWPRAGFPYRSRAAYEQRVRDAVAAALPYVAAGRQVIVQCENEVGDVTQNPSSTYWRGTTDQYLAQLSALFEAVRGASPSMPVAMSSFSSGSLEIVINPSDPRYTAVTTRFARMLGEGQYDVADLHFYDCVETIGAKVAWVTARLPSGRAWISTENGGPDPNCPSTPLTYSQNPSRYEDLEGPAGAAAVARLQRRRRCGLPLVFAVRSQRRVGDVQPHGTARSDLDAAAPQAGVGRVPFVRRVAGAAAAAPRGAALSYSGPQAKKRNSKARARPSSRGV